MLQCSKEDQSQTIHRARSLVIDIVLSLSSNRLFCLLYQFDEVHTVRLHVRRLFVIIIDPLI